MNEEEKGWTITSNALTTLQAIFETETLTPEKIREKALCCGLPMNEIWKAEHLYEEVHEKTQARRQDNP